MKKYGIIYKIINKANGKIYIGQTIKDFNKRYPMQGIGIERVYRYHNYHKKINYPYNKHLLSAIEKYGFNSFETIEEFDIAYSKDMLDYLEDYYIRVYSSSIKQFGYNNKLGGANGKLSIESIEKMKATKKNNASKLSPIERKLRFGRFGNNNPNYGKERSKETKQKISNSNKGRIISDEQREKIKNTLKEKYKKGELQANTKKVICITTNKIFNSIVEGAKYYGCERRNISYCCNGKLKSCGKHPITKEKLVWAYYNENKERVS